MIATSARQGEGIAALRAEIASRVTDKKATRQRIEADLRAVAARLNEECGTGKPRSLAAGRAQALEEALAESAGVPTVVAAIERSTRLRAGRATGWPVVSWLSRLRPDPLRRLHLDLGAQHKLVTSRRATIPKATPVQRAKVDTEVRALADDVSAGTDPAMGGRRAAEPRPRGSARWPTDSTPRSPRTDLGVARLPVWAGAVRVLQWLLILAALVGGGWTVALAASGSLGDDSVPAYGGIDLPIMLLVGGVAVGILLALLCRVLVDLTARRRAAAADHKLRAAVHEVSQELVVSPVEHELDAFRTVRTGLDAALGK